MNIKIPKSQLNDYLEHETCQEINSYPDGHGGCYCEYVVQKNGKYYMFVLAFSYSEGIQPRSDYFEIWEVKPVEKTAISWETVK